MKQLVEQILAKKYNHASKTFSEEMLRRAVDNIEERKVYSGKTFFESIDTNELDEELEPLDEISKSLAQRYIKKAEFDAKKQHSKGVYYAKKARAGGIEDVDDDAVEKQDKAARKYVNRIDGIHQAKKKLLATNEETLQELSRRFLKRYADKAWQDSIDHSDKAERLGNRLLRAKNSGDRKKLTKKMQYHTDKEYNRLAGVDLAKAKMAVRVGATVRKRKKKPSS